MRLTRTGPLRVQSRLIEYYLNRRLDQPLIIDCVVSSYLIILCAIQKFTCLLITIYRAVRLYFHFR